MNKIFSLIILAAVFSSCGTAYQRTSTEFQGEEIDVGYGKQNSKNNTYAISKLKVKKKEISSYSSIYDYIQGRIPGVQVVGEKITIRGISTINGTQDPLLIVDGVKVDNIGYLNPADVLDVTVLKDASASIYGFQGANGVIMIRTKSSE